MVKKTIEDSLLEAARVLVNAVFMVNSRELIDKRSDIPPLSHPKVSPLLDQFRKVADMSDDVNEHALYERARQMTISVIERGTTKRRRK